MTSDEELMDEMGRGSRTAFETLFGRYRELVWRFFRRRAPDAARAEELAQDTFVALLDGAARYERRGPFRSYLFGIAYNVLQADRRKAVHRATDPLDDDPAGPDAGDPDRGIWVRDALGTARRGRPRNPDAPRIRAALLPGDRGSARHRRSTPSARSSSARGPR